MHGDPGEPIGGVLSAQLGLDVALERRARGVAASVAVIELEDRFDERAAAALGFRSSGPCCHASPLVVSALQSSDESGHELGRLTAAGHSRDYDQRVSGKRASADAPDRRFATGDTASRRWVEHLHPGHPRHEQAVAPRRPATSGAARAVPPPRTVLALQLDSNRNAIYKNRFDARRRLRACLAAAGHPLSGEEASA
jgi:hypothetical protein